MYLQHFGLRRPLFDGGIAQDAAVFLDEARVAAMTHVSIALTSPDSAILLCGPPGIGKTTFAAAAIRTSSSSTRMASTWLSNAPLTPNELLELLLAEFGFDPYKHSRVERLQIWRQFLTELGATDTRIFIAVEQAENVPPPVLHALSSLTVADPNGCPGANLVLMGQEGVIELMSTPCLKELKQRVRLMRRFEALSDQGVEAYLGHCAEVAGGHYMQVFAAESIAALHAYSGGIPRVLNNLCDTALALTAAGGESKVTAALVTRAAVEFCGMQPLNVDNAPLRATAAAGPAIDIDAGEDVNPEADRDAGVDVAPGLEMDGNDAEADLHAESETELDAEAGESPDEIPVLTESVEIDLGSGEYEAVPSAATFDAAAAGIDEQAVPLAWDPGATLDLTFAQTDLSSLLSAASHDTDDESGDYAIALGAEEPDGPPPATTRPLLDDVDLDQLTAELAEAILSADPPDLDYPHFPEIVAGAAADTAAGEREAESAETADPLRARA